MATKSGIGNEPWYKSRRIWGAVISAIAAALVQLGYSDIASLVIVVGAGFGVTSWLKPK